LILESVGITPFAIGFIAANGMNSDGKAIVRAARKMVTWPSHTPAGVSDLGEEACLNLSGSGV
jgi:hypothetical protein